MLRITLLGSLQIVREGRPVTGFVSSKAQALLCYLALTARPHARATLAGLLWGELPEADARMNLRHVLTNLRQVVGAHLRITRETVEFDRSAPYWLDVEHVQPYLHSCALPTSQSGFDALWDVIKCYRGDLLEGFHVREAPAFEEWLLMQRECLRQRMLHALHEFTAQLIARGAYTPALDCATRLLALDPLREETYRQLMHLLVQIGKPSAALLQYQACIRMLDDELGTKPATETTLLFEQIKARYFADRAAKPMPTRAPATERRQMTLLACQVRGLLALAERLDLDALDNVLNSLQMLYIDVANQFGGRIAEQRSDGVLIAFGAPQLDPSQAAVRAALALLDALNQFTTPAVPIPILKAQIGIHTGQVIVAEKNDTLPASLNILGLPLIAVSRLQSLAAPATILMSGTTERRGLEWIAYKARGTYTFDELKQPLAVFQVVRSHPSRNRLSTAQAFPAAT